MKGARISALIVVAVAAGGAAGDKPDWLKAMFVMGPVVALVVVLGLPLALALHAFRRGWVDATARAVGRATTACALSGAGLLVAALFAVSIAGGLQLEKIAYCILAVASFWFFVGFAGCARRHGERMLGVDAEAGVRPLVLGWLARAGLFAIPVAWPFVGLYVVIVALGAPLVALFAKDSTS